MNQFFIFNGQTLPYPTPIMGPDNRGLKYGDGLFETLKCKNQRLILAEDHFLRMWEGLAKLQFEIPENFTAQTLTAQVESLLSINRLTEARVRISIFRSDGGFSDAMNNLPQVLVESFPLSTNYVDGIKLCLYQTAKKSMDEFSHLKLNNFLPYRMANLYAKKNNFDDAILLNNADRICETTNANIFTVKNEVLSTPALQEGPIAGVIRKFLIHYFQSNGILVRETEITIEEILQSDEVFITNSIRNIQCVDHIEKTKFANTFSKKLIADLQQKYPKIFG